MVANNIRAEMARQRWSGRKLATRLGVQPTWVNRRTSGATPLDPNDIALFADVLGVSIQSLFGNEKTPPTPQSEGRNARLEGLEPPTFCSVAEVVQISDYRDTNADTDATSEPTATISAIK